MSADRPELSIIIPAYNEQDNIDPLYERLVAVLDGAGLSFEVIVVDDGSEDATANRVRALGLKDSRVRLASLSRNFGHEAASSCGFQLAKGKATVLMDSDLQDPPEVILELVRKWREGYDIVCARRSGRDGETALKRVTSYLFYRYFNRFSGRSIPNDVGDFRLVDQRVMAHFNKFPERNRFVRGMFSWLGFSQAIVDFKRESRHKGKTKYNYFKLFWLSWEAVTSFSVAPLRLCMGVGVVVMLLSFILASVIVVQKLLLDIPMPGYALATSGMFLLGGVQLIFLGVIGEYVGKIYTQVQGRPIYILKEDEQGGDTSINRGGCDDKGD